MSPAISVMRSIADPEHPLYHGDCPCCHEHYEKDWLHVKPEQAIVALDWIAEQSFRRLHGRHRPTRLQDIREAQHMRKEQLAKISGVSLRQITNLEDGLHMANWLTALRLAVALGVEVEDLEGTS